MLNKLIKCYQKTLSPDHSPFMKSIFPHGHCKYIPTCSEYARQTLKKHGIFKGLPKITYRLLRCNPWSKGGQDLP